MQNWKSSIAASGFGKPACCPPATGAEIDRLEDALQSTLPAELRSLLLQTNGVREERGSAAAPNAGAAPELSWILDAQGILDYNREVRDENSAYRYMDPDDKTGEQPIEDFLVFSNIPGNGDLYAICLFPIDGFRSGEIVLWDHDDNERILAAPSLSAWIQGWGSFDGGHESTDASGTPAPFTVGSS